GVDGLSDPVRSLFSHAPSYDADRLVAFVVSRSQVILLPAEERDALVARVRAIAPAGEFVLPLVCETWRGVRT
ncbi:MAG: hypothetical protein QOC82_95, partial [Frankiaceae bacterium]|nr:hypothetical protein [Frankiaceae bacterium]